MPVHINTLEYFRFSIGGHFDGNTEITIEGDLFECLKSKQDDFNPQPNPKGQISVELEKELIDLLNKVHVTLWLEEYCTGGICDGTNWELEMKYNNRKTSKIISGSNAYPTILKVDKELVAESDEDYTKEFKNLLKILNKLAEQKNYFY